MFDWFKSKEETPTQELRTWDPRTVTMQQPTTPEAATTNQVVSEQPVRVQISVSNGDHKLMDSAAPTGNHAYFSPWWWRGRGCLLRSMHRDSLLRVL
ncbi:hypothetical protein BDV41DRAFT_527247 [Aspergillus transmontanensis]|uniref:Uncharacterized protein n=1 Tax=Aspergillus transmontanensis TaxID=1034304 RepID=A0A5N6W8M9_9EURO|nr:hypothetical protein BDV41DRAFT_527247 [Aspergillus transmontanensis]